MGRYAEILGSVGEYLLFLDESGFQEISLPVDRETRLLQESGPVRAGSTRGTLVPTLEDVKRELGECMRCALGNIRRNIVFGEGNPRAEIVLVGEGPGEEEDETGRPFVGRAGQLLTRIIESGMRIDRSSVYICNIVKCRPPGNRTPRDDEVETCLPFLKKQIEAIHPTAIIALGKAAAFALLGDRMPMHRLRGRWHSFQGIPVMPTFHPSYVLRRYTLPIRKQVHEDTQEVLRFIENSHRLG